MAGLLGVARGIDAVNGWIGRAVAWLIFAAVIISAVNAIIRKAFDVSSNSWLEMQWYLFGAAFFLAAAYTLRQNEHIRIDIIYGGRSRRTQHWIDLLGHLLFLMPFVALMIAYFIPYFWTSAAKCQPVASWPFLAGCEVSTNAGGLWIWPGKLIPLVGFALLGLQGLSEIIKKIAVMAGKMEDPHPHVSSHESGLDESLIKEIQAKAEQRND